MNVLMRLLIRGLSVVITSYLLPGIHIENFLTAIVVGVVLGIINTVIKPVLIILTLPINLLTLGLFTFLLNGLLVLLTSSLVPGFRVDNFGWAILFSILISCVSWFLDSLTK